MELRQLHSFITIAQVKNFTQAAEILGYAQSTLTTQIQLLEQELGTKLFERLGRGISLTSEGGRFLPYARQIIKLCTEAREVVAGTDIPSGTLAIGSVESLCVLRLPELLKEYHRRYPLVDVVMKIGNCAELRHYLRENTVDIAFIFDSRIDEPDLKTDIEVPEAMVFLAAPTHPLTRKAQITPRDFCGEALILTESACSYRKAFEDMLHEARVAPKSVMESASIQAIKQLAISGLGATLLPRVAVEEEIASGHLIVLPWAGNDFGMKMQVLYHKDKWMSSALKAFLSLAAEMLK